MNDTNTNLSQLNKANHLDKLIDLTHQRDENFMAHALENSALAYQAKEVPVGAVIVYQDKVIATGFNQPISTYDPSAHAEIIALRRASALLGNYRLPNCEIFVTLEPCAMCAGAITHARLSRLVFGANDPKTGACGSVINLFANAQLNHHTKVNGGILATQCAQQLKQFFAERRSNRLSK